MSDLIGKGYVERAEKKATQTGKYFVSVAIAGQTGSCWDGSIWPALKVGAYGEYEFLQKGQYTNLIKFLEVEKPEGSVPTMAGGKDERIARSHAITSVLKAIELGGEKIKGSEAVLAKAIEEARFVEKYTTTGENPFTGSDDPLFREEKEGAKVK